MKGLLKTVKLWEEMHEKEEELNMLIQSFEGREIRYRGKIGYIHSIDPANEMALIVFREGGTDSMHFRTFVNL